MSESSLDPKSAFAKAIWQKDKAIFDAIATLEEPYSLTEDSLEQSGVPRGTVTKYHWRSEKVYAGTERDYWLYVPQQYDGSRPACLMIFQDGGLYLAPEHGITVALDNLIAGGEMPITIGLFVNPGDKGPGSPIYGGDNNRSFEYDSLSDQYARFLIEELIPAVAQNYTLVDQPEGRAICGLSSGGICAFTAAWERPDVFGKVISHCGSFTDIRGGHNYPSLIRKTPNKPLRVVLQSGANDLDVVYGNWPLANYAMASALAYREYDYLFMFGNGGHTLKHGASIFPNTLRWLWRDYPKED